MLDASSDVNVPRNQPFEIKFQYQMPTKEELLAAVDRIVPDVIAVELDVLFCGINPGLYTAWSGHHFARPGNRFWPALHLSGFTPRLLAPSEERELLQYGCGVTNLVQRASVAAAELSADELRAGGQQLARTLRKFRPRYLAVLGIGAYQTAFGQRKVKLGLQAEQICETNVWVLPNPSGLNANYKPAEFAELFAELRTAARGESRDAEPPFHVSDTKRGPNNSAIPSPALTNPVPLSSRGSNPVRHGVC